MLSEQERIDIKEKLQTCFDHIERFNDWEKHFIENNFEFFDQHQILSRKQLDVLDNLYDKVK